MKILAVIPARQNSTRVPNKNTMRLGPGNGKPNLVRTIEAVKSCDAIETIAVVTDDEKAAKLALLNGCRALEEPPHVAKHGDLFDVMDFALRHVDGDWEAVALAYPNVPIRPPNLFNDLLDRLIIHGGDSVAAVARDRRHGGGSIFRINYLRELIVDRTAVDRYDWRVVKYPQDEIVEIDTLEDVTWANTLLQAQTVQ